MQSASKNFRSIKLRHWILKYSRCIISKRRLADVYPHWGGFHDAIASFLRWLGPFMTLRSRIYDVLLRSFWSDIFAKSQARWCSAEREKMYNGWILDILHILLKYFSSMEISSPCHYSCITCIIVIQITLVLMHAILSSVATLCKVWLYNTVSINIYRSQPPPPTTPQSKNNNTLRRLMVLGL